jgi:sigma-B regulation protein RsbU (phosphoserine phosphatase)
LRSTIKILILDKSKEDSDKISKYLLEYGYLIPAETSNDELSFRKQLDEFDPDVILCDHVIPGFNSFRAMDVARQKYPNIVFILVSSVICEEFALELIKEGIDDYVMKNQLIRLPHVIESSYIKHCYQQESKELVHVNEELVRANEIIKAKNKSMTQSIIFAERIQHVTFPKIDVYLKEFPEAFILYKPKDIVSGDFYWISNTNNRIMTVVADCTGHGVSGALLSMIGYNFLNDIIANENNLNHPTDILSLLDSNICKLLHQDENSGYQDGIDIAFISIDKENKKIYFSGCKRPLLLYKKKEKQIIEYKGEPYLIGGVDTRITKTFKSQEIPYKTGDTIYMFTDGYVDQFGGVDNKKLMKENFIDILLSFKHLGLYYQGQLLEQRLIKWRGEFEQTDDILVVGIKL